MPLPSLHVWVADDDFFASDINGNFTTIVNKFTDAAGAGIGDGDIASDAAISGLKLSNASGRQIETDRLKPDCVTADILRDDGATDSNRAVTTNHIRDLAVTKGKVKLGDLTKAQLAIATQLKAFGPTASTIGQFMSVTPVIVQNGDNYRINLSFVCHFSPGSGADSITGQIIIIDPTTPIVFANNTILDVRFTVLTGMATGAIQGTVEIVSIPNS